MSFFWERHFFFCLKKGRIHLDWKAYLQFFFFPLQEFPLYITLQSLSSSFHQQLSNQHKGEKCHCSSWTYSTARGEEGDAKWLCINLPACKTHLPNPGTLSCSLLHKQPALLACPLFWQESHWNPQPKTPINRAEYGLNFYIWAVCLMKEELEAQLEKVLPFLLSSSVSEYWEPNTVNFCALNVYCFTL